MSKKSDTTHDSSTEQWLNNSEFTKPTATWLANVRAAAEAYVLAKKRVPVDSVDALRGADTIKTKIYSKKNVDLRRAAWACGLDGNYWAAVNAQVEVVEGHTRMVPKDLRTVEVISPADEATVAAHAALLADIRSGLARNAAAQGVVDQVELLGRGDPVGVTPGALVTSYDVFLTHAPERTALLLDAGIGAAKLEELRGYRNEVQAIVIKSGAKQDAKAALPAQVNTDRRALQCLVESYAGRMGIALAGQQGLRTRALSGIPRRSERRRGSGEEEGSGEGSGAGEQGTGDAEHDSTGGAAEAKK